LSAGGEQPAGPTRVLARVTLTLLAVLAFVLVSLFAPPSRINGDTSWLIHVVETLRAGGKAYVDVVETNPPMAFLIYWPAVALAPKVGLSPETAVYVFTIAIGCIAGALTMAVAQRAFRLSPLGLTILGVALAIVFGLVPSRSFTQREHLALMLVLPAVMALAARADGHVPFSQAALAAGLLAGVGASIKPHFVLAIALPALAAALVRRDWRPLFSPEAVMAGLLFTGYCIVWIVIYPAFFKEPLFLIQNSYRLYAYGWPDYLREPPAVIFLFCCVMGLHILWSQRQHKAVVVLSSGLIAFAVAFAEQGKGFAYHLYPVAGMTLLLPAFVIALGRPEREGTLPRLRAGVFMLAGAGVTALSAVYSSSYPDSSDLRRALLAEKPRPSLIVLSFDIAVNFPLAREVGGAWSSRLQSLWMSNSAGHALKRPLLPEQRSRTEQTVVMERQWLAEDIARNRPDLVVIDGTAVLDHMLSGQEFRAAFEGHYTLGSTAQSGRFLIFRRAAR
jgi:hypothetical protein